MQPSRTQSDALVESAYKIRPGTVCSLNVLYAKLEEHNWDSSFAFDLNVSGYITSEAVKADSEADLTYALTITQTDSIYNIHIDPLNSGVIPLSVYYYQNHYEDVVARSAFNTTDTTYYKDYEVLNDIVVPMSVIEIPMIPNVEKRINVSVTPRKESRGITFYAGSLAKISSEGLLEYESERHYVLRKGTQRVALKPDIDCPYIEIAKDGKKIVEFENMEWQDGYSETSGILSYIDKLLILTNKSLCVFDFFGDFVTQEIESEEIIGNDLTLLADDHVLVTSGNMLKKYRIKHDNILLSEEEYRLYFREQVPAITLNINT